jgi:hypothetical protein
MLEELIKALEHAETVLSSYGLQSHSAAVLARATLAKSRDQQTLIDERDKLRESRDDLLFALQGFAKYAYHEDTDMRVYWEEEARKAITRATEAI